MSMCLCNLQPMETPSPVLYKHQRMRDEDVPEAKRVKQDIAEENKVRVGQRKESRGWE